MCAMWNLILLTCKELNKHVQYVDEVGRVVQKEPERQDVIMEPIKGLTDNDQEVVVENSHCYDQQPSENRQQQLKIHYMIFFKQLYSKGPHL